MDFYKDYFWAYSKTYGFIFAYISLMKEGLFFFFWRWNMYALLKYDLEKHHFYVTRENTFLDLMTVLKAE